MKDQTAHRPVALGFLWTFAKGLALCVPLFVVFDVLVNGEGLDLSTPETIGPWLLGRVENWRFLLPFGPALGVALGYLWLESDRASQASTEGAGSGASSRSGSEVGKEQTRPRHT